MDNSIILKYRSIKKKRGTIPKLPVVDCSLNDMSLAKWRLFLTSLIVPIKINSNFNNFTTVQNVQIIF